MALYIAIGLALRIPISQLPGIVLMIPLAAFLVVFWRKASDFDNRFK